jgi:predicted alpha-1,6-mannanase (GH76 family)
MVVPGTCSPGIAAGMAALQLFYNTSTGLWDTTNWWNAANALETTIEYSRLTDTLTYRTNIYNTFYQKPRYANFINPWFRDDDGWWALAWIKAYDLTGETKYLDQAKTIVHSMEKGWETTFCGGGLYWHKRELTYKNAITNSLFLAASAKLHLREPNDPRYLQWAQRSWQWFKQSGMISIDHLVNDGLDSHCRNNGKTIWTYNQGVLIGGLVDLYRSTQDQALLDQADAIADATLAKLTSNGILREGCEPDCGNDGPQFKGIFMRNLSVLYQVRPKPSYRAFIVQNANAIWANRSSANQFGLSWASPFDKADATRQSSAIDVLNAAISVSTQGIYPAETATLNHLKVSTLHPNFEGNGYVTNWTRDDQSVQFNVNVACSGQYDLAFRYASTDDAVRYLYVNGKRLVDRFIFPKTGGWQQWQQVKLSKVWLNAGDNTASVIFNQAKGSNHDLALDALTIDASRDSR